MPTPECMTLTTRGHRLMTSPSTRLLAMKRCNVCDVCRARLTMTMTDMTNVSAVAGGRFYLRFGKQTTTVKRWRARGRGEEGGAAYWMKVGGDGAIVR